MITKREASRKIHAALKTAFPNTKFTVALSAGRSIAWTDDGPSVTEVQDALLAAGCGEEKFTWDKKRWIEVADRALYFDRFNAAERAAEAQRWEQSRERERALELRTHEVIVQATRAKRARIEPLQQYRAPPIQDPTVFEAFERLRQRAESQVTIDEDAQRRPSWAPPLILGEELAAACLDLGYLTDDDKWIGRLWATFATPKRSGRWLREHTSKHPLHGIQCRGFELYAGGTRGTRAALLFEAQRTEAGEWQFGPREYLHDYYSPRSREWEQLIRERERIPSIYNAGQLAAVLAELTRKIEAIDAEDHAAAIAHRDRQQLRQRAFELARARVLDFIGAPDMQMQLAGRLCGHCCICFKALTDSVSLERGIGPDCFSDIIDGIRAMAAKGRRIESIVALSGMPADFVTAVLSEEAQHA
jgi:hypothetical protein